MDTAVIAGTNEVVAKYIEEKRMCKLKNVRMKKGRLQEIISMVKSTRSLPTDFNVSMGLIKKGKQGTTR